MNAKAKRTRHPTSRQRQGNPRRWSARVMKTSNALDLEPGVFTQRSSRAIATSLKRSALASGRRKAEPFQSAMSMLNFHINRSGRGLTPVDSSPHVGIASVTSVTRLLHAKCVDCGAPWSVGALRKQLSELYCQRGGAARA
jgi:hypothetical protein